jgi:small subunit ribosomal protein S18
MTSTTPPSENTEHEDREKPSESPPPAAFEKPEEAEESEEAEETAPRVRSPRAEAERAAARAPRAEAERIAPRAPREFGRPGGDRGPDRGLDRGSDRGPDRSRDRDRGRGGRDRRFRRPKRRVCAFCVDKITHIDYKNYARLRDFVSDRGKILKSRQTGTCNRHQRDLSRAIKQARQIALLPFAGE